MSTETTRLALALVGCGRMGANHARILSHHSGARLAAVVDANADAAAALAAQHGVPALGLDALPGRVDGVVVAAATAAHPFLVEVLLEAGLPVLVEKPLAADHASGAPLVALAEARGLPLAVGMVERFNPAVAGLAGWLAGQRIDGLEARRANPGSGRIIDASVLVDLMIHDLDVVLHLLSNRAPDRTALVATAPRGGSADHAVATLAWGEEAHTTTVASLTASRISHVRARHLTVWAERGTAVLDYTAQSVTLHTAEGESVLPITRADQLTAELTAFADWIRTGAPSGSVTGREALTALAVLDRLAEAAA